MLHADLIAAQVLFRVVRCFLPSSIKFDASFPLAGKVEAPVGAVAGSVAHPISGKEGNFPGVLLPCMRLTAAKVRAAGSGCKSAPRCVMAWKTHLQVLISRQTEIVFLLLNS